VAALFALAVAALLLERVVFSPLELQAAADSSVSSRIDNNKAERLTDN
jgi:hypothetical protein